MDEMAEQNAQDARKTAQLPAPHLWNSPTVESGVIDKVKMRGLFVNLKHGSGSFTDSDWTGYAGSFPKKTPHSFVRGLGSLPDLGHLSGGLLGGVHNGDSCAPYHRFPRGAGVAWARCAHAPPNSVDQRDASSDVL